MAKRKTGTALARAAATPDARTQALLREFLRRYGMKQKELAAALRRERRFIAKERVLRKRALRKGPLSRLLNNITSRYRGARFYARQDHGIRSRLFAAEIALADIAYDATKAAKRSVRRFRRDGLKSLYRTQRAIGRAWRKAPGGLKLAAAGAGLAGVSIAGYRAYTSRRAAGRGQAGTGLAAAG